MLLYYASSLQESVLTEYHQLRRSQLCLLLGDARGEDVLARSWLTPPTKLRVHLTVRRVTCNLTNPLGPTCVGDITLHFHLATPAGNN